MASKPPRSPAPDMQRTEVPVMLSEQARQQLVLASEVSSVMYRAAEALQQIQQHMTQRAALRYKQVADQMREAASPAELLAIQSGLLTSGVREVAQYMQDVTTATLRIQSILLETRPAHDGASMAGQAASVAMQAWHSALSGGNGLAGHPAKH